MNNPCNDEFWAHTETILTNEGTELVRGKALRDHLDAVADIAEYLATLVHPEDAVFRKEARLAGQFHDFGKYTAAFQKRIRGKGPKCKHAIHGAMQVAGPLNAPLFPFAAMAIAGHHAGLYDYSDGESRLSHKLKDVDRRAELPGLIAAAKADSETQKHMLDWLATNPRPERASPETWDLYVRMLFSCLVDADRLHTAERSTLQAPLEAQSHLNKLLEHIDGLQKKSTHSSLSESRQQILTNCLAAADRTQRLFSLSVPTGGGKTLAAMAFALKRAALFPEHFRRIVVVIPYLSIIEQNAAVYREIFGPDAVLEHHSGSIMPLREQPGSSECGEPYFVPDQDEEDEQKQDKALRPETENWDAPIIVTTSTRFFESLFSNRPKDLRRVHNLARSIVILDEVQTLPRRLLAPLLVMQKELADGWGVNFVFSTATQPAFETPAARQSRILWPAQTVAEIIPDPETLRAALRRATLDWRIDATMNWKQVATELMARQQALAVVNLRDHALELYNELAVNRETREGLFHLSTRMSAAHRLRVLESIRARLRQQLPCHVVSTQLIEAGVDLDFPFVMRALAPLDAIVQAAGRADREGKRTAALGRPGGEVLIFRPEDERTPPHEYKEATDITRKLAAVRDVQVDDAESMRLFYEGYYSESDGEAMGTKLSSHRERLAFATLAKEFEYINSRTLDVFVPDDAEAVGTIKQLESTRHLTSTLRRALQLHMVGLNPKEFQKASDAGVIRELERGSQLWVADTRGYDETLGLVMSLSPEGWIV